MRGSPGLRVVPENQVKNIKSKNLTSLQIAGLLQVASVLQGEIKKTGNLLNIHVDLIDGGSGEKIWSRDFESGTSDLFSFQNELAQLISGELHTKLSIDETKRLSYRPTQNLEAYDQYLKGIYYWN